MNLFCHTQNISPGLVATEFMASYSMFSPEAMAAVPTLDPDDVATAAIYVLSNPPHVLVSHTYVSRDFLFSSYKIKSKKLYLLFVDTGYRVETSGRIVVIDYQDDQMHIYEILYIKYN